MSYAQSDLYPGVRRSRLKTFIDITPLHWTDPSGISVQISELYREFLKQSVDLVGVNYSFRRRPTIDERAPIGTSKWLPGLRKIEERSCLELSDILLKTEKHDVFCATAHFVPNVRAKVVYFIYDCIKILFPDLDGQSAESTRRGIAERIYRSSAIVTISEKSKADLQSLFDSQ